MAFEIHRMDSQRSGDVEQRQRRSFGRSLIVGRSVPTVLAPEADVVQPAQLLLCSLVRFRWVMDAISSVSDDTAVVANPDVHYGLIRLPYRSIRRMQLSRVMPCDSTGTQSLPSALSDRIKSTGPERDDRQTSVCVFRSGESFRCFDGTTVYPENLPAFGESKAKAASGLTA